MTDLTAPHGALAYFLDLHPAMSDFRADVLDGLSKAKKSISPKYFYDAAGSKIFDRITELDEYYPTRTEKSIFLSNANDIASAVGAGTAILEYGSGSSDKVEWLLGGIESPAAYVAMDISKSHLLDNASALADIAPVPVAAICADFNSPVVLPTDILPKASHWLGYFPGSTLGNFTPDNAIKFLQRASDTLGENANFLLGIDLVKEPEVLNAAYDDREGVTAAFNLNLLHRMRRELDAEINIEDFEHYAFFNASESRIEMHVRAVRETQITLDDRTFSFAPGETIHTENSYKYTMESLSALFAQTPWRQTSSWTDERGWFAACLLSNS